MMAIAKPLLLIAGVTAQVYGQTPPNAKPPTEHLREQRGMERGLPFISWLAKALVGTWALLEALVLLVHALSFPTGTDTTPFTTPTPSFTTGIALIVFGGLLRVHCYRTLGAHFTFELSIRPTQALVTHGVYRVVRHPSYTGILGLALGLLLCALDRRGVVVSLLAAALARVIGVGVGDLAGVVTLGVTGAWAIALSAICLATTKRMDKEDAMLEQYFGDEWRAWARVVPYRLVPGVC